METNIIDRGNHTNENCRLINDEYEEVQIRIVDNEEDHYKCLQMLTNICQPYDDIYLRAFIEDSTHLLFYRKKGTKDIVGFNLLKLKKKHKMDIVLTCATVNTKKYGIMLAFGAYRFAIKHKVHTIMVSPRTPELRQTFIRHGYVHLFGTQEINEVLEKHVSASFVLKSGDTTRRSRAATHTSNSRRKRNVKSGRYTLKHAPDSDNISDYNDLPNVQ